MSIVIVDFGSQYTHLITKRLNYDLQISTVLVPYTNSAKLNTLEGIRGVVLSGGPQSVGDLDKKASENLKNWFQSIKIPVLGVCFGLQWLVTYFGGTVEQSAIAEFGCTKLIKESDSDIFNWGKSTTTTVLNSHQDKVTKLPEKFKCVGSTKDCKYAFIEYSELKVYGVQFHPEVTDTEFGLEMYKKFVYHICLCQPEHKSISPRYPLNSLGNLYMNRHCKLNVISL